MSKTSFVPTTKFKASLPASFKTSLSPKLQKAYVHLMMDVISRGLVTAAQSDAEINKEVQGFPAGFVFSMQVIGSTPKFFAQIQDDHSIRLLKECEQPDLAIKFKHLNHAFLVFSFQEGTAQSFANDRMIADGDVAYAIRLVRCLNKMEALILPKLVANLAVKEYPKNLSLPEKVMTAKDIYLKLAQSYVKDIAEIAGDVAGKVKS